MKGQVDSVEFLCPVGSETTFESLMEHRGSTFFFLSICQNKNKDYQRSCVEQTWECCSYRELLRVTHILIWSDPRGRHPLLEGSSSNSLKCSPTDGNSHMESLEQSRDSAHCPLFFSITDHSPALGMDALVHWWCSRLMHALGTDLAHSWKGVSTGSVPGSCQQRWRTRRRSYCSKPMKVLSPQGLPFLSRL